MRRFLVTLGLALGFLASNATPAFAQINIDNFSQPVQGPGGTDYLTIAGGVGASNAFVQSGTDAVGGTRVYYGQKTNADPAVLQLGIGGNQAFRFIQNPVTAGRVKLLYGYSAVNISSLDSNNYTSGHTLANLNIDASGFGLSTLNLDYSLGGNASTGTITVTLLSGSEGTSEQASVTLPVVSTGFSTLAFNQGAFVANNPNIDFGDIDQVVVSMDGLPGGVNASIDNIRIVAVPEPTVIALGAIGVAGLGATVHRKLRSRRRRRRVAKRPQMA